MGVTWITPTEITPSTASAWTDVDVSSHIASGATGVILHVVNNHASTNYYFGCRKNGSADNRHPDFSWSSHSVAFCGVDSSRILELYVESKSYIDVYLVGYIDSCAVFYTNATDISLTTITAWTDIDINVNDNAVGAIVEIYSTVTTSKDVGFRKNGSTDNRTTSFIYGGHGIIGLDSFEIMEAYTETTSMDFYLKGYIKSDIKFNTNATNTSMSTTGSFSDLSSLPTDAKGGFFEVVLSSGQYSYALRKNGSSENIYRRAGGSHAFFACECDSSQLIEGKIENTGVDFYMVGYTKDEPKGNQLFFGMNF